MELLVHFVSSQNMYLNDLNSDAKFYLHSFNSFKMMVQNMVKFVPSVTEKVWHSFLKHHIYFSVKLKGLFSYTDQPKRKALFSRSLRKQKFSNAYFRGENSTRFRVSSCRPFFSPRNFAEKLHANSRRNSANFRPATPRKLREPFKKNVNSLIFCFVWFVVLHPSQQLRSCRDGQIA